MLNQRSVFCLLLVLSLWIQSIRTERIVHEIKDLYNAKVEAASWSVIPASLPSKFDYCEGHKTYMLGGLVPGPMNPLTKRYTTGPSAKPQYSKTFSTPMKHVKLRIRFRTYALHSTDGCGPQTPGWSCCGPDYYRVFVNNQQVLASCSMVSHNKKPFCHNYQKEYPNGGGGDLSEEVDITVTHSDPTLTIKFTDEVNENLDNEAFGWANLWIQIIDGPQECLKAAPDGSNCATCDPTAALVKSGLTSTCRCPAGTAVDSNNPLKCKGACPECESCVLGLICKCPPNSKLTGIKSCGCNNGFYPASFGPLKCDACHGSCSTCKGPGSNQCTSCGPGMSLSNGVCTCSLGFYAASSNPLKCQACHSSCQSCSGPNDNQCTACKITTCAGCGKLKLFNGKCGHCNAACEDCNSPNDCIRCSSSAVLVGTTNRTCGCALGSFQNAGSHPATCTKCASCVACAPDGSCSQCTVGSILTHVGAAKTGVCTCSEGTYIHSKEPVACAYCHASCKTCNGALENQCLTCKSPLIHVGGKCQACHSSCGTCSGTAANQCSSCPANAKLVNVAGGHACKCSEGYYELTVNGLLMCKKCDPTCHSCNGPTANQCHTCHSSGILVNQKLGAGNCICHDGEYISSIEPFKCGKCPNNCKTCISHGANKPLTCSACTNNHKLVNGSCIKCSTACLDCDGEGPHHCTKCPANADLVKGSCVCNAKFYSETQEPLVCKAYECFSTCKTCLGPHRNQCLECKEKTEKKSDGSCAEFSCHKDCLTCAGSDETHCSTCKAGAELHAGTDGKKRCVCSDDHFTQSPSPNLHCIACERTCQKCSTNAATCTICPANAVLQAGKCHCAEGFHDAGGKKLSCVKCAATCKSCTSSADHCASCPTGLTLHNNKCIKCSTVCATCNGEGDSNCLTCHTDAVLHDFNGGKTCVCKDGFYTTSKDPLKCSSCQGPCEACSGPGEKTCTKCTENAILESKGNDKTCQCLPGYFASSTKPLKCTKCNSSCKTCSGSDEKHCTACHQPHVLEQKTGKCITCHANCQTCDGEGPNHCTGCTKNGLLQATADKGHTCHCKPGTFASNTNPLTCSECTGACLECSGNGVNKCSKCTSNAHLVTLGEGGHTCQCVEGYFSASVHPLSCAKCDSSCKTCKHPMSTDCLSCHSNQKLIGGRCITCSDTCADCDDEGEHKCTKCPPGADLTKSDHGWSCQCKHGYAPTNTHPLICEPYTCHATCKTCKGPKESDCTACLPDHDLMNGKCKERDCHDNCIKCSKANDENHCTSCTSGANLVNGKCLCKEGYFTLSVKPLTCSNCHPSCTKCKSEGAVGCTECVQHANLKNSVCVCKDGFFENLNNHGFTCDNCHVNCPTCNGPNSDSCMSCPVGKKLLGGRCIQCNHICADCNGEAADKCTSCAPNAQLIPSGDGHTCQCKPGFWSKTASPLHCEPYKCDSSCATCSGPEKSHCITCREGFNLVNHMCVAINCHQNCATCNGTAATDCKSCTTGAHIGSSKTCECEAGYAVSHLVPLKCDKIQCHKTCNACLGTGEEDCTTCIEHALHRPGPDHKKGSCRCATGFFQNRHHCEKCSATCTTCKGPNHNECTDCSSGQKLIHGTCITCHHSCSDCEGPNENQCTKCHNGHHRLLSYKGGLVCQCPEGYLGDKCEHYTCHPSCKTCSGPNVNQCLTCTNTSLVLKHGECHKPDCHFSCTECDGPRDTDCKKCGLNSALSIVENSKGKCQCSAGFHQAGGLAGFNCTACDHSCKTCKVAGEKGCETCFFGAYLHKEISEIGACHCEDGTFKSSSNPFKCTVCDSTCKTCGGSENNKCLTCHEGHKLVNGRCIKCHAHCLECTDEGFHCSKCDPSSKLIELPDKRGHTCGCDLGTYITGDESPRKCKPCHKDCKTCTGEGHHQCASCTDQNAALHTLIDGTHNCQCIKGFYAATADPLRCEKLVCDKTCSECTGPHPNQCTNCPAGSILQSGECKTYKCHGACLTCSGPGENECETCMENAKIVQKDNSGKTCSCLRGFNEVSRTPLVCKKIDCHSSCKRCTGKEENQCIECYRNGLLNNGHCECVPPNIVWSHEPYLCSETWLDYSESVYFDDHDV